MRSDVHRLPGGLVRRAPGYGGGIAQFNGNFALLFSNVVQSVQTDLGLTYGGTLLPGGSATDTVTLTGTLATKPVPILAKGTGTGVVSIYYDGGTTPAMTGVTPSAGVPVALTGAASGLFLTWTAATIALNNTWNATCSALADQVGANSYSQATLARQYIVTPGINGFAGIASYTPTAAAGQFMASGLTLANSGSFLWSVFRVIGTTSVLGLIFDDGNGITTGGNGTVLDVPTGGSTNTQMFNTTGVNTNTASTLNTWGRAEVSFTNSTADYYKFGAGSVTGANAGTKVQATGRAIGSSGAPSLIEMLALVIMSSAPSVAQLSAASAAVTAKYGAGVAV